MRGVYSVVILMAFSFALKAQQKVGIGTNTPSEKLHVVGNAKVDTVKANAIQLGANAGSGKVLTSDAAGNASWQLPSGSTGSAWSLLGNTGTNTGTNYIGTNDAVGLRFKIYGISAGILADTNTYNTSFGFRSLMSVSSGNNNLGFGSNALFKNLSGSYNTGIGSFALYNNIAGEKNIAIGSNALYKNLANHNVAIGYASLYNDTSGARNIGIGTNTFFFGQHPQKNIAIGYTAGQFINASDNIVIGDNAGQALSEGVKNIIVGNNAEVLEKNMAGAIGYGAYSSQDSVIALGNTGHRVAIARTSADEKLHVAGNIKIDSLAGSGNRYVFADAQGKLFDSVLSVSGGADNWGTQTVQTNATLSGNGTSASPLSIAQQGAATGQVLKWNGSSWQAANDNVGASLSAWNIVGNAGTNADSNFVGTIDSVDLRFRVNNKNSGVLKTDNTSFGYGSYIAQNPYSKNNLSVGIGSMDKIDMASFNVALGDSSLARDFPYTSYSENANTAIGYKSMYRMSYYYTDSNTAVGYKSLSSVYNANGTTAGNSAFGVHALADVTGDNNNAFGIRALKNSTGSDNIAFGQQSGLYINGSSNIAMGTSALSYSNGSSNIAIGLIALNNTSGSDNIRLGKDDPLYNYPGPYNPLKPMNRNTLVGNYLMQNIQGDDNTLLGYNSLQSTNSWKIANRNVVLGQYLMQGLDNPNNNNVVMGNRIFSSLNLSDSNIAIGNNIRNAPYSNYWQPIKKTILIGNNIANQNLIANKTIVIGSDNLNLQNYSSPSIIGRSIVIGNDNFTNYLPYYNYNGSKPTYVLGDSCFQNYVGYSLSNEANIAIGQTNSNTLTGSNNVSLGHYSSNYIIGDSNTAFGNYNMKHVEGHSNVSLGTNNMQYIGGNRNIAVGNEQFLNTFYFQPNQTFENISIGNASSKYLAYDNSRNIVLGNKCLITNSPGSNNNIAIGNGVLQNNYYSKAIGIGDSALSNMNWYSGGYLGNMNLIAIGSKALFANHSGKNNLALGNDALSQNMDGNGNTAIGTAAISTLNNYSNNNTALGDSALYDLQFGNGNTVLGKSAMRQNGYVFTGNNNNTILGFNSGKNNFGSNNTAIGANTTFNNMIDNTTLIGASAVGSISNSIILGDTVNNVKVGIGTSDPETNLHVKGNFKLQDGTQALGKVLTSDAAGNATWQTIPPQPPPSNIPGTLATQNFVSGFGFSPITANYAFYAAPTAVTITSATQKVFITSSKALGAGPTAANDLSLYIVYNTNGAQTPVFTIGGGSFGYNCAANTRNNYTLSATITGLAPGTYYFGLGGITSSANWTNNEYSYTTVQVFN